MKLILKLSVVVLSLIANTVFADSLHNAVRSSDIEMVQALIAKNTDVNKKDRIIGTPLHYAAANGDVAIAKLLITAGANVDATSKTSPKKSPIYFAAGNGHLEMTVLLLKHGASIEILNTRGTSALHEAALSNHAKVAEILIQHGANIDLRDTGHQWTALHQAARFGHMKMATVLVEYGANVNIKDDNDKAPVHLATYKSSYDTVGDSSLIQYLLSKDTTSVDALLEWKKKNRESGDERIIAELERLQSNK